MNKTLTYNFLYKVKELVPICIQTVEHSDNVAKRFFEKKLAYDNKSIQRVDLLQTSAYNISENI